MILFLNLHSLCWISLLQTSKMSSRRCRHILLNFTQPGKMSPTLPKFFTYLLPMLLCFQGLVSLLNFPRIRSISLLTIMKFSHHCLSPAQLGHQPLLIYFKGLWKLAGLYGSHFSHLYSLLAPYDLIIERIDKTAIWCIFRNRISFSSCRVNPTSVV